MTVGVQMETTGFVRSRVAPFRRSPKPWLVHDFKLRIDGLEAECKQVAGVGAVSAQTSVKKLWVGARRLPEAEPTGTGHSTLVVALPKAGHHGLDKATPGFRQWYEDSVKGRSSGKRGSLEYLSPGGRHSYLRLDFRGLGIQSLTLKQDSTHVAMYFESMSLSAQPAALAG
jgi:hypothetical protein